MTIYCKIDSLLKERKMGYQELSKTIDVSYVGLWKLRKGKFNPSMELIEKICKALKCDVGDLFSLKKK